MLSFLPPAGSVVLYKSFNSDTFSNYLVTGYTCKTIAELHNIDTGNSTCIIMQSFDWSISENCYVPKINPYITIMN